MSLIRNVAIYAAMTISVSTTVPVLASDGLTIKQITENGSLDGSIPGGLKFSPNGERCNILTRKC